MPTTTSINVNFRGDSSKAIEQLDRAFYLPDTWRERFIKWSARQLGVRVEVKRRLRWQGFI